MALIGHLARFLLALRLGHDRRLTAKARFGKQEASLPVDENLIAGSKMILENKKEIDNKHLKKSWLM